MFVYLNDIGNVPLSHNEKRPPVPKRLLQNYVYPYIIRRLKVQKEGNKLAKRRKRKSIGGYLPAVIIICFVIAAAVVIILTTRRRSGSISDAQVEETVARLKAMESRDMAAVESQSNDSASSSPEGEAAASLQPADASSLPEIQQQILDHSGVYDNVTIRQKFAGTAIIGDSITESTWEYGYLDQDVVISQRGLSVINADDQIATTIAMNPKAIFMAFGSNDLESYESNVQGFIDGYKGQVRKLQEALPGVPIYINCVLPITEAAIAEIPALQYYPQYNEALISMCNEFGLTFIDNAFIVNNNPQFYEPDGEHMISEYYPMWLSYMAHVAGL